MSHSHQLLVITSPSSTPRHAHLLLFSPQMTTTVTTTMTTTTTVTSSPTYHLQMFKAMPCLKSQNRNKLNNMYPLFYGLHSSHPLGPPGLLSGVFSWIPFIIFLSWRTYLHLLWVGIKTFTASLLASNVAYFTHGKLNSKLWLNYCTDFCHSF